MGAVFQDNVLPALASAKYPWVKVENSLPAR
jgi:hypothetical protein